ncbi:MAG TPA: hypothetical protein VMF61_05780 [Candidatus Acidoferrales bacterium]|nr:hypothetical protein [Candidatus Acidoferrales bacterium]
MRAVSRSLVALAVASAAAAAATAHYAIDVVADYAVAHASFDDIRSHGAREVLVVVAVVLAGAIALRGLQQCCRIAESPRGGYRVPSWWWLVPFAGFVTLGASFGVPAMETLDARMAGVPVDGLSDAFGGSIAVGLATTIACSLGIAIGVFALARWLLAHRHRIAAAIAETFERRRAAQRDAILLRRFTIKPFCRPRFAARRRGKRAPPFTSVLAFALDGHDEENVCCTFSSLYAASLLATCTHPAGRRSPALR